MLNMYSMLLCSMSFIEALAKRANNNYIVDSHGMILSEHHVSISMKNVRRYIHSVEKEKNKKYD